MLAWLRLCRPHTSALTWAVALLGYLVAGGRLYSWEALTIFLFGLLFHIVGFSDNAVCDYEYDREDPSKQHFPLVTGEIRYGHADFFVKSGLVLLLSYPTLMGWPPESTLYLLIAATSGLIYNRFNKKHLWKVIPISVCFSLIPVITAPVGPKPTPLTGWIWLYIFLMILFQIGTSGELKEIERPRERNILRVLGTHVTHGELHVSVRGELYTITIKTLGLGVGLIIALHTGASIIVSGILFSLTLLQTMLMLTPGPWDREKKLKEMSRIEILTYLYLLSTLHPTIGTTETIILAAAPIAWFTAFNRILWGSIWFPKV